MCFKSIFVFLSVFWITSSAQLPPNVFCIYAQVYADHKQTDSLAVLNTQAKGNSATIISIIIIITGPWQKDSR